MHFAEKQRQDNQLIQKRNLLVMAQSTGTPGSVTSQHAFSAFTAKSFAPEFQLFSFAAYLLITWLNVVHLR